MQSRNLYALLATIVVLLTVGTGGAVAIHEERPSDGSISCEVAPSVAELPNSDTALQKAIGGVATARYHACGETIGDEAK